ncbi:MAG: hypothetical protein ACF8OB_18285, partial [Phycisphaeraceae bacterium JB051]
FWFVFFMKFSNNTVLGGRRLMVDLTLCLSVSCNGLAHKKTLRHTNAGFVVCANFQSDQGPIVVIGINTWADS